MMKNKVKKFLLFLKKYALLQIFFCQSFIPLSYAQSANTYNSLLQENDYTLAELLSRYLENDLELKKIKIGVEKSELDLKQTKINQGFDVTLSTGTMTFYSGPSASNITVKPSVTAKLPTAKNLTASFSTDYQHNTVTKTNEVKDTKLSAGFELLSKTQALSKVEILKSERQLLESKRNFQKAALNAEKKFYNELTEILDTANQIYTYLQDVYMDKLNLEKLKAQGYNSTSSTYRIAQMKLSSGEHDIETGFHNLKKKIIIFYQKCGINVESSTDAELYKFIPIGIPECNALSFTDFQKEKYEKIEKASWTYTINELARKADKYFTLGLNGGYTFNNATTKSDTVDAGVSTIVAGNTVKTGVSVPLGKENFTPAFNLSLSVTPNSFATKNITKQQNELSKKQELIDIKTAERDYDTAVISFEQTASNLNWEKESVNQNLMLYKKTEQDLYKYFNMGIITESEWMAARNNLQLYEVKSILNKLEYILYNNDVMSQFVDVDFIIFDNTELDNADFNNDNFNNADLERKNENKK